MENPETEKPNPSPEMLGQIEGLDVMMHGAFKSSNAPKQLSDSWDRFVSNAKKFASGESLESTGGNVSANASHSADFKAYREAVADHHKQIQTLVTKFQRILPEPFCQDLEKLLSGQE